VVPGTHVGTDTGTNLYRTTDIGFLTCIFYFGEHGFGFSVPNGIVHVASLSPALRVFMDRSGPLQVSSGPGINDCTPKPATKLEATCHLSPPTLFLRSGQSARAARPAPLSSYP
jgi:hypothetical protein